MDLEDQLLFTDSLLSTLELDLDTVTTRARDLSDFDVMEPGEHVNMRQKF